MRTAICSSTWTRERQAMIRRLHYTGRIRIHRTDVRLVSREDQGAVSFDAELRLGEYDLPPEALVFIEAYRQTNWMRFPFGTAGAIQPPAPEQRRLREFDSVE